MNWQMSELLTPILTFPRQGGRDFTLTPALSLRERGFVDLYS